MDIATPSEGVSPVLTIFLFIFLLLGAIGLFIFQENQKRAGVAAAEKVRRLRKQTAASARPNAPDEGCLRWHLARPVAIPPFMAQSSSEKRWMLDAADGDTACDSDGCEICRYLDASVTAVVRSMNQLSRSRFCCAAASFFASSSCRRRSCPRRRWLARRARTARNSPVSPARAFHFTFSAARCIAGPALWKQTLTLPALCLASLCL